MRQPSGASLNVGTPPKLAILFWFYKAPDICLDRVELLRKHNPNTLIFGLFGGEPSSVTEFDEVNRQLDDLYVFRQDRPALWKWMNGDLMIRDWYSERGKRLIWDSIVVVQWDMVVAGPVTTIFSMVEHDELLLSGLRPISEIEASWKWVRPERPKNREAYQHFLAEITEQHDLPSEPLACLFIVAVIPRSFLMLYSAIPILEHGFVEYRLPIYAQVFGTTFCTEHPFRPWWNGIEPRGRGQTLIAIRQQIPISTLGSNLLSKSGARIFHPFHRPFPRSATGWVQLAAQSAFDSIRLALKALVRRISLLRS